MYTFLRFPDFRLRAVTLSYDDGNVYDKRLIEIMDKYGLKGTFNINSGFYGGTRRLSREEAVTLYKDSGHEVAVHGVKHLSLAEVDKSSATWDVIADRYDHEQTYGMIVRGMAYANGSYSDEIVEVLKRCGIAYSRTVLSTEKFDIPTDWLRLPATCHHRNPRLMELVDEFLDEKPVRYYWNERPRLFYLWGHSYEFNDNDNWEVIENFAKKIGNRENIWYATNIEIYNYVKAYEDLIFSLDLTRVKNLSRQDVWLCVQGKNVLAKAGEETEI